MRDWQALIREKLKYVTRLQTHPLPLSLELKAKQRLKEATSLHAATIVLLELRRREAVFKLVSVFTASPRSRVQDCKCGQRAGDIVSAVDGRVAR